VLCSKRVGIFLFLSSVSKQVLIKGWKFLQNIFASERRTVLGRETSVCKIAAASFSKQSSIRSADANCLHTHTHTHTHTEDGCLNVIVPSGTFYT